MTEAAFWCQRVHKGFSLLRGYGRYNRPDLAHRYTAGVYSLLPGGMDALPSFKICADPACTAEMAAKSSGCFRVSRTLEAEASSDSDTQPCTPTEAVRAQQGF